MQLLRRTKSACITELNFSWRAFYPRTGFVSMPKDAAATKYLRVPTSLSSTSYTAPSVRKWASSLHTKLHLPRSAKSTCTIELSFLQRAFCWARPTPEMERDFYDRSEGDNSHQLATDLQLWLTLLHPLQPPFNFSSAITQSCLSTISVISPASHTRWMTQIM